MPSDAAKSQWGCHFMISSGHLPCTQQWSATCLSGHCHSTSDCIYLICQNHYSKCRSNSFHVIFPQLRQTPFKTLQQTSTRTYPHQLMTPSHNKMQLQQIHRCRIHIITSPTLPAESDEEALLSCVGSGGSPAYNSNSEN